MAKLAKSAQLARLAVSLPMYARFSGVIPRSARRAYISWVRSELEHAGCLFVKIGQWVSSRTDIFPGDITEELAVLKTQSAPMNMQQLQSSVQLSAFDSFDLTPVSTGSIAQVHRAVFAGQDVAVKVQRPGILEDLEADIGVIRWVLGFVKVTNPKMYDDLMGSLDDLITTVKRELDFFAEAGHMKRFRDFFLSRNVVVPRVLNVNSTAIVMDFIDSSPFLGDVTKLMEVFFAMFFELGWLHTDLHSGNIAQTGDGTLVLFDFGSVLECPENIRLCIKHLMVAYVNRVPSIMVDYMLEYGLLVGTPVGDERVMLEAFVLNILEYVEVTDTKQFTATLKTIPVPASGPSTTFCPEIFLIMRSFTLLEGLCKELDPDFVILEAVSPLTRYFVTDPMMYRLKIEDDARTLWKYVSQLE